MLYKSYTLGLHIPNGVSQLESLKDPRKPYRSQKEPIMANLGDLNPFGWALDCFELKIWLNVCIKAFIS